MIRFGRYQKLEKFVRNALAGVDFAVDFAVDFSVDLSVLT
jgi:hypothetical protein